MDVKKAIETRRSIRKYQNKAVPENLIRELIDAARLAPSGNNAQPSKYYIVTNEADRKKLKENEIFKQDFVYTAPVILVCCTDPGAHKNKVEGPGDAENFRAIRDVSIATAFLVLRATELGLGTCYVGWAQKDKIKDALNIPQEYIIPYVITIGYPDEQPQPTPRKKIDEIIL